MGALDVVSSGGLLPPTGTTEKPTREGSCGQPIGLELAAQYYFAVVGRGFNFRPARFTRIDLPLALRVVRLSGPAPMPAFRPRVVGEGESSLVPCAHSRNAEG